MAEMEIQVVKRSNMSYYPFTFLGFLKIRESMVLDGNGGFVVDFHLPLPIPQKSISYKPDVVGYPEIITKTVRFSTVANAHRMPYPVYCIDGIDDTTIESAFEFMIECGYARRDHSSVMFEDNTEGFENLIKGIFESGGEAAISELVNSMRGMRSEAAHVMYMTICKNIMRY